MKAKKVRRYIKINIGHLKDVVEARAKYDDARFAKEVK